MSTTAHATTIWLADRWEDLYPSAVLSGIVGDLAHQASGGYHISIMDQPSTNYSVVRVDDKAPPGTWPRSLAAAVDMSMSLADMKLCHARLKAAWANTADPRRVYLNAFNGWDGQDSPGRYDYVSGGSGTSDDSHKWHTHLEIRRRWVTSMDAAKAVLSILAGDTVQTYLTANGGAVAGDELMQVYNGLFKGGDKSCGDPVAKPWVGSSVFGNSVFDHLAEIHRQLAAIKKQLDAVVLATPGSAPAADPGTTPAAGDLRALVVAALRDTLNVTTLHAAGPDAEGPPPAT